jgi:hypothetical protein
VEKLQGILQAKGVKLFALVDHSGAEKAGMKMRPTKLLIFGNPKAGTPVSFRSLRLSGSLCKVDFTGAMIGRIAAESSVREVFECITVHYSLGSCLPRFASMGRVRSS